MGFQTVIVELTEHGYPVHIGAALLEDAALLASALPQGPALIVSNDTVAPLYLERLQASLPGNGAPALILPDGEAFKTLNTLERILDALVENRITRDGVIIALGGGVITDLAGFAAATWMRGIGLINVPTTLLAQVDASIGGKTGINHEAGKNLIGAFHQPRAVISDTSTLDTLPRREYVAGLAEVVKCALIQNADFFAWLEQHTGALTDRDPAIVIETVARCCRIKADIVAADEREQGVRALLNLGHTFGHAIETLTGYSRYLHGEAVAIGLVLAARLSVALELLDNHHVKRIRSLLSSFDLPVELPQELTPAQMIESMALDKKVQRGKMRFVVLEAIGKSKLMEVDEALVSKILV